jgi:hypothetical protein
MAAARSVGRGDVAVFELACLVADVARDAHERYVVDVAGGDDPPHGEQNHANMVAADAQVFGLGLGDRLAGQRQCVGDRVSEFE